MTAPVHLENAIPPIFEIIASGFKKGTRDAFELILTSLISSMKKEQKELIKLYKDIDQNNDMLLNEDLENFYDALLVSEKNAKKLFNMAKQHKDKSEVFMLFYKTADELYDTLAKINYDLGTIESKLIHEGKLEYAS